MQSARQIVCDDYASRCRAAGCDGSSDVFAYLAGTGSLHTFTLAPGSGIGSAGELRALLGILRHLRVEQLVLDHCASSDFTAAETATLAELTGSHASLARISLRGWPIGPIDDDRFGAASVHLRFLDAARSNKKLALVVLDAVSIEDADVSQKIDGLCAINCGISGPDNALIANGGQADALLVKPSASVLKVASAAATPQRRFRSNDDFGKSVDAAAVLRALATGVSDTVGDAGITSRYVIFGLLAAGRLACTSRPGHVADGTATTDAATASAAAEAETAILRGRFPHAFNVFRDGQLLAVAREGQGGSNAAVRVDEAAFQIRQSDFVAQQHAAGEGVAASCACCGADVAAKDHTTRARFLGEFFEQVSVRCESAWRGTGQSIDSRHLLACIHACITALLPPEDAHAAMRVITATTDALVDATLLPPDDAAAASRRIPRLPDEEHLWTNVSVRMCSRKCATQCALVVAAQSTGTGGGLLSVPRIGIADLHGAVGAVAAAPDRVPDPRHTITLIDLLHGTLGVDELSRSMCANDAVGTECQLAQIDPSESAPLLRGKPGATAVNAALASATARGAQCSLAVANGAAATIARECTHSRAQSYSGYGAAIVAAGLVAECSGEGAAAPSAPFSLWRAREATLPWPAWRPERHMDRTNASRIESWWATLSPSEAIWHYLMRVGFAVGGSCPIVGVDWAHAWGWLAADSLEAAFVAGCPEGPPRNNAFAASTTAPQSPSDHTNVFAGHLRLRHTADNVDATPSSVDLREDVDTDVTSSRMSSRKPAAASADTLLFQPVAVHSDANDQGDANTDPTNAFARAACVIGARKNDDDAGPSSFEFEVVIDGTRLWLSSAVIDAGAAKYGVWASATIPARFANDLETAAAAATGAVRGGQPRSNEEAARELMVRRGELAASRELRLVWPSAVSPIVDPLIDIISRPTLAEAFLWLWQAHHPSSAKGAFDDVGLASFDERMLAAFAATGKAAALALRRECESDGERGGPLNAHLRKLGSVSRTEAVWSYRGGDDEVALCRFWAPLWTGKNASIRAVVEGAASFCRRAYGLALDKDAHFPLLAPLPTPPPPSPRTLLDTPKRPPQMLPDLATAIYEGGQPPPRPFFADERSSILANCTYDGDLLGSIMPHCRTDSSAVVVTADAAAAARTTKGKPLVFDQMWDAIAASKAFEDGLAPTLVFDAGFPVDVASLGLQICLLTPRDRDPAASEGMALVLEVARSDDGSTFTKVGAAMVPVPQLLVGEIATVEDVQDLPFQDVAAAPDQRGGPHRYWRLRFLFVDVGAGSPDAMSIASTTFNKGGKSTMLSGTFGGTSAAGSNQAAGTGAGDNGIQADKPIPCVRRFEPHVIPQRPDSLFAFPTGIGNSWVVAAGNRAAMINLGVDPRSRMDCSIETTLARSDALDLIGIGNVSSMLHVGGGQVLALGGVTEAALVDAWSLQLARPIEQRSRSRHLAGLPPPFNEAVDVAVPLRSRRVVERDPTWAGFGRTMRGGGGGATASATAGAFEATLLIAGSVWMVQRFPDGVTVIPPRSLVYLCGRPMHELDVHGDFTNQTTSDPPPRAFPFNEVGIALPAPGVTQRCAQSATCSGDIWYFASTDGRFVPWLVPFVEDVVAVAAATHQKVCLLQSLEQSAATSRSSGKSVSRRAPPKNWFNAATYALSASPLRTLWPYVDVKALVDACPIACRLAASVRGRGTTPAAEADAHLCLVQPKAQVKTSAVAQLTDTTGAVAALLALDGESSSDDEGERHAATSGAVDDDEFAAPPQLQASRAAAPRNSSVSNAFLAPPVTGPSGYSLTSLCEAPALMAPDGVLDAPVVNFEAHARCSVSLLFKSAVALDAITIVAEPGPTSWTLFASSTGSTEVEICRFDQSRLCVTARVPSSVHSTVWTLHTDESSARGIFAIIPWRAGLIGLSGFRAMPEAELMWGPVPVESMTSPVAVDNALPLNAHGSLVAGIAISRSIRGDEAVDGITYPPASQPFAITLRAPASGDAAASEGDEIDYSGVIDLGSTGGPSFTRVPPTLARRVSIVPASNRRKSVYMGRPKFRRNYPDTVWVGVVPEALVHTAVFEPTGAMSTCLPVAGAVDRAASMRGVRPLLWVEVDASTEAALKRAADAVLRLDLINGDSQVSVPLRWCHSEKPPPQNTVADSTTSPISAVALATTQHFCPSFVSTAVFRVTLADTEGGPDETRATAVVLPSRIEIHQVRTDCVAVVDGVSDSVDGRQQFRVVLPSCPRTVFAADAAWVRVAMAEPRPIQRVQFTVTNFVGIDGTQPRAFPKEAAQSLELQICGPSHAWVSLAAASVRVRPTELAHSERQSWVVHATFSPEQRTAALVATAGTSGTVMPLVEGVRFRFGSATAAAAMWRSLDVVDVAVSAGDHVPADPDSTCRAATKTGVCRYGGAELELPLEHVRLPAAEGSSVLHCPSHGDVYCCVELTEVESRAAPTNGPGVDPSFVRRVSKMLFDVQILSDDGSSYRSVGLVAAGSSLSWDDAAIGARWRLVCVAVEYESIGTEHPRFDAPFAAQVSFGITFRERGFSPSFRPLVLSRRAVRIKSNMIVHPPKSSIWGVHSAVANANPATRGGGGGRGMGHSFSTKSAATAVSSTGATGAAPMLCCILPSDQTVTGLFLLYDFGTNAPAISRIALRTAVLSRRLTDIELAVQCSDDNVTFATVALHTQRATVGAAWQMSTWNGAQPRRYWRLAVPVLRDKGVSFADDGGKQRAHLSFAHAISSVVLYTHTSVVTPSILRLEPSIPRVLEAHAAAPAAPSVRRLYAHTPMPLTYGALDRSVSLAETDSIAAAISPSSPGGPVLTVTSPTSPSRRPASGRSKAGASEPEPMSEKLLVGRVPPSITRACSALDEKCEIEAPTLTNPHVWHGDPKTQTATIEFWSAETDASELHLENAEVFPPDDKELPVVRVGGTLKGEFMHIRQALALLSCRWMHDGERLSPHTLLCLSFRTNNIDAAALTAHFGPQLAPLLGPVLLDEGTIQSAILLMASRDMRLPIGGLLTLPAEDEGSFDEVAWDQPLLRGSNLVYSDQASLLAGRLPASGGGLRAAFTFAYGHDEPDAVLTVVARASKTERIAPTLGFDMPGKRSLFGGRFRTPDGIGIEFRGKALADATSGSSAAAASPVVAVKATDVTIPNFDARARWTLSAVMTDSSSSSTSTAPPVAAGGAADAADAAEFAVLGTLEASYNPDFVDLGVQATIETATLATFASADSAGRAMAITGVLSLGAFCTLPFSLTVDPSGGSAVFEATAESMSLDEVLAVISGRGDAVFPGSADGQLSCVRLTSRFSMGTKYNPVHLTAKLTWPALGPAASMGVDIDGFLTASQIALRGTLPQFELGQGAPVAKDARLCIAWSGSPVDDFAVTVIAESFVQGALSVRSPLVAHSLTLHLGATAQAVIHFDDRRGAIVSGEDGGVGTGDGGGGGLSESAHHASIRPGAVGSAGPSRRLVAFGNCSRGPFRGPNFATWETAWYMEPSLPPTFAHVAGVDHSHPGLPGCTQVGWRVPTTLSKHPTLASPTSRQHSMTRPDFGLSGVGSTGMSPMAGSLGSRTFSMVAGR